MGRDACARCTRIWCVRPVSGRARTNAATKRLAERESSFSASVFGTFFFSVSFFRFRRVSAANGVSDSTAQTVSACFGNDASMSGCPPSLAFGSGGGGGCTQRASAMDACAPTCASTVNDVNDVSFSKPFSFSRMFVFLSFSEEETRLDASPALSPSKRTTALSPPRVGRGTRPTQSARYSLLALANGAASRSSRNCRANPSASVASFTNRHTPLVSMSSRCTTRGASASSSRRSSSFPSPARRRTCPRHRESSELPSNLCVG